MMSVLDILGDIGYGFVDATNAAQGMYQNMDKSRVSDVAAQRQEQQLLADQAYDIFNATAGANRQRLDTAGQTSKLQYAQTGDKLDDISPQTREDIRQLVDTYGANTPEFKSAYSEYLVRKGRIEQSETMYEKARKEIAAEQQTLATLIRVPGYEDVKAVQIGKDDRLYGYVGEPDENGNYAVVELPESALRQYAALTGNTKLLNYDIKAKQMEAQNAARAAGYFPGQKFGPKQVVEMTQNQVINATASTIKALMAEGIPREQAEKTAVTLLIQQGVKYPQSFLDKYSITAPTGTPGSVATSGINPAATGAAVLKPLTRAQRSAGVQLPMTPTASTPAMNNGVDYGPITDALGNFLYAAP
jgi:hypothetical protein